MPSLQVFKAGKLAFSSDASGLRPLASLFFTQSELLQGAEVYDKVVGEAAARIFVIAGVKSVRASIASKQALERLHEAGIPATAEKVVDTILNMECTGMCPMEKLSLEHTADEKFIEALRERFGPLQRA